ncbi:PadR family transcriptional regulator [Myxococcus sp. MISCRS1]|uniref:PadR family transcriptional regulator n=1 Tax=Myxococcus sp. MISCRS1 TaxID=2996786 RepID=UPI002270861F|nr:PadR family transcriptional regulator [Myxococcus sp. MISCRS1]MCY1003934.1 PadR family transcriptional regulator [Myxococcus sp. MISCRS1]
MLAFSLTGGLLLFAPFIGWWHARVGLWGRQRTIEAREATASSAFRSAKDGQSDLDDFRNLLAQNITSTWSGILGVLALNGETAAHVIHEGLVGRKLVDVATDPREYLYGVLRDLEARGWVASRELETSPLPGGPTLTFYSLTDAGRLARQVLTQ